MDNKKLEHCIQLIRKLPPKLIEKNADAISTLIYEEDELLNCFLQKIDVPTTVCNEDLHGEFLKSEYNRDGDSYRSPYSNTYFPPVEEDARYPTQELRDLEVKLNKIFAVYAKAYYSSSTISSVYVWELGESIYEGFCIVVLIKNQVDAIKDVERGVWDSSNFITVTFIREGEDLKAELKLTTTVILQMSSQHQSCGSINLSGTITKQMIQVHTIKSHVDHDFYAEKCGQLIEDMENTIRSQAEEIYLKKSKEIIDTAKFSPTEGKPNMEQANKLKMMFHQK